MSQHFSHQLKTLPEKIPELAGVFYLESTDSTNSEALRQAHQDISTPALFVAGSQRAGRGRMQRVWDSPPNQGLYLSLLLKPKISLTQIPLLSLLAGLALNKILQQQGWQAQLKWPNDVLLSGKKVAGILCEMHFHNQKEAWVVVGLGLNLFHREEDFPPELREKATSLSLIPNHKDKLVDPALILTEWLKAFFSQMKEFETPEGTKKLIAAWEKHSQSLGKKLRLQEMNGNKKQVYEGIFLGLSEQGHLRLQLDDGKIEEFAAGDVTVLN